MHLKFENNAARKSRLRNVQSPRPCTSRMYKWSYKWKKKIRRLKNGILIKFSYKSTTTIEFNIFRRVLPNTDTGQDCLL
jgi:hypothetical protein